MTTKSKQVMRDDFEMTRAEADACAYLQRMPYRPSVDLSLNGRICIFLNHYGLTRESPEPSAEVDNALFDAFTSGDYSRLDEDMPRHRATVEAMFARAEFDCVRVD